MYFVYCNCYKKIPNGIFYYTTVRWYIFVRNKKILYKYIFIKDKTNTNDIKAIIWIILYWICLDSYEIEYLK